MDMPFTFEQLVTGVAREMSSRFPRSMTRFDTGVVLSRSGSDLSVRLDSDVSWDTPEPDGVPVRVGGGYSPTAGERVIVITVSGSRFAIAVGDASATTRLGGVSDYSEFEADGTLVAHGAATCWVDVLPCSVDPGTASSSPQFSAYYGGMRAWEFSGTVSKEIQVQFQMPHGYAVGTDIVPHVHVFFPLDASGGSARFGMEYSWANVGDPEPGSQTTYVTVSRPAGAGPSGNEIVAFPAIVGTGKGISSVFSARIFRDPGNASDTYGPSAWLKSTDIHCQVDMAGSRSELSK